MRKTPTARRRRAEILGGFAAANAIPDVANLQGMVTFLSFSRLRRCWTFWEHTLTPLSPQLTALFTEIVTLFSVATTSGNQESLKAH